MSVQEAISVLDSKQKDQISDAPKRKTIVKAYVNISKSTLRRWSASMGDPFSPYRQ